MRIAVIALCLLWTQLSAAHADISAQLESVNRQLKDQPNDYSLYLVRGELKRHEHDWEGAEADFARADELAPERVRDELYLYRGNLFEEAGQARRAVAELDPYIARHPEHIEALRIRALAHEQLGEFDLAIADYTRLITLDSGKSPELWLERARLSLNAGYADAAMESIDAAIGVFGPLASLVEFAVETEIDRGNYSGALDQVGKLPQELADTPEWLWRHGQILEHLGQLDEANGLYRRAEDKILQMPPRRQQTPAMQDLLARLKRP